MNNQLKAKAKNLPEEVFAYLDSFKSDDLNILIVEKYKLNLLQLKAYYDLIPRLFLKEISAANLVEEVKRIFGFSDNVARQMACDIAGARLLVVTDWLQTDVIGLIKSWGGNPDRYQTYVEDQRKALDKEAQWTAEQWAEPFDFIDELEDEEVDWPERQSIIKEIFVKNLAEVLGLEDDYLLIEINDYIFYILANVNENFNDELSALMLENSGRLTNNQIMLDGRLVEPTVANWLAYFLAQKGSDFFDAIVLSDFITNSPNTKSLSSEERYLLTNLLVVYRNLKFFPDSLPSNNPRDWFIFPLIDKRPVDMSIAKDLSSPVPVAPVITPPRFMRPVVQTIKPEPEYLPKIRPEDPRIKELEAEAAQYVEGSLERLALEEEIEKLSRNR